MTFLISNRLKTIASHIRDDVFFVDIGCDHALLPIFLSKTKKLKGIIATDINIEPLKNAEKNIKDNNLEDQIQTFISDGLENIPNNRSDDIAIAGMGGELIKNIIEKWEFSKNSSKHFILQPMSKHSILRSFLYENGFNIHYETPIIENKKIYTIMSVFFTGIEKKSSHIEKIIGKISPNDEIGKLYIKNELHKIKNILNNINNIPKEKEKFYFYKSIFNKLLKLI